MAHIHKLRTVGDINNAKYIILGTVPGQKSLGGDFYYLDTSHNSFWKILSSIFNPNLHQLILEKKYTEVEQILVDNKIVLSDVIEECDRDGSSDNRILNAVKNKEIEIFNEMLESGKIEKIYFNGGDALDKYYKKYFPSFYKRYKEKLIYLKSSSGCTWGISEKEKIDDWKNKFCICCL